MSPKIVEPPIEWFEAEDKPYDRTYGQWTNIWWQWAFSMPESKSPISDETGKNANFNQPEKDVWFLAGTIATEDANMETYREVTVPSGRSILFPIMTFEANFLEYPNLKTDEDLITYVEEEENTISRKEALINENLVYPKRIKSDPRIFELFVHENNTFDVKSGDTRASSDGYYIFLRPLPKGLYEIRFRGACKRGKLNTAAKYHVEVC